MLEAKFGNCLETFRLNPNLHILIKTRASRTTGAKGSNFFARNSRLQIADDHMEDQIASISY